jgi:pilus assembly protein CpaF
MIVGGGTSSGKTTFLNVISQFISNTERVITIEDCAELNLTNINNVIRLETRTANSEGAAQITISDLIRTSLRMRPTRIIIGEVRGKEAFDMLQAMNTGHDGSMCTVHANSCADMLIRLETMVVSAIDLPIVAIRRMICSAVDILIHLAFINGRRRVIEIAELVGLEANEFVLNVLFHHKQHLESNGNKIIHTKKFDWYE